jgi:hypothetical protein
MRKPTHDDIVNLIIDSIRRINPYSNDQGRKGYIYASGFLAAFLAKIIERDPYILREFQLLIEDLKNKK